MRLASAGFPTATSLKQTEEEEEYGKCKVSFSHPLGSVYTRNCGCGKLCLTSTFRSLKPSYKRASSTQTGTILPRNPNLSIATNPSKPLALLNSSSSFITSFKSHQNFCLHRSVHELKPVKYVPEKGVWPAFSPDAFKVHYYEIYQTHLRKLNDLLIGTFASRSLLPIPYLGVQDPSLKTIFSSAFPLYARN